MIRLTPADFNNPVWVEKLALAGNLTTDQLRARFGE
jgi:hypothetical protein